MGIPNLLILKALNEMNRLEQEIWVDDSQVIDYAYDDVVDQFSSLVFTYDDRNRIKTVDNTETIGVPSVVLAYSYDAAGNMLTVTDTIDAVVSSTNTYTYDGLNRVTEITQSGNGVSDKKVDCAYNVIYRW